MSASCAPVEQFRAIERYRLVRQNHIMMGKGDHETAIRKNEELLYNSGSKSPADVALFNLGLLYAKPDYSGRDYAKTAHYFKELTENFPGSPLSEEASVWLDLLGAINKSSRRQELRDKDAGRQRQPARSVMEEKLSNAEEVEKALLAGKSSLLRKGDDAADLLLYRLALIHAHYKNPKRDFKESAALLKRLLREYPESSFVEDARIWLGVYETLEKMQQVDFEIEEKKKEFKQ